MDFAYDPYDPDDPEAEAEERSYALGFSEDGHYELGIIPLLLPGAVFIAARMRAARGRTKAIREAAKREGVPAWQIRRRFREERRKARREGRPPPTLTPQSASTPRASTVSPTRDRKPLFRFFKRRRAVSGDVMPRGRRLRRKPQNALRRAEKRGIQLGPQGGAFPGGGPRCVLVNGDDGITYAVDEYGNAAVVTGADEDLYEDEDDMEDRYYNEDDDDDYGDDYDDDFEGDDEYEDDEIMGDADEAVDDLQAVVMGNDQEFGAAEDRLQKRIDKLSRKIERIQDKPLRAPFKRRKRKKRAKRIARLRDKRKRLLSKKRRITGTRQAEIAAVTGIAAGVGAASGLGMALMSRQGQQERFTQGSKLYDPQFANQLRRQQTQAGLVGRYVAPPGSGRLNRVPMFADGSANNPRNALTVPAAGITAGIELATEDLPYVLVKLLGFYASTFGTASDNDAIGLVEDLRIKGGTNLFLHEAPANADDYNTSHDDQMVGLRSYPNIRSPNQAFVTVKAAGDLDDVVVLTTSVVVDILEDDTYGAGFAGPYAG